MAYCTVSDLLAFVPSLRAGGSTEATTSYLSMLTETDAARITSVLRYKGFWSASFDLFQSRLLRFLNCLASAQTLVFVRGNEVDPAYLSIVRQNQGFLAWMLDTLLHGYLDVPFLGHDYTLPLDYTRPSFYTTTFSGIGVSTISITNNYNDTVDAQFTVQILSPTTFQWRRDTNPYSSPVTITGSSQALSDGIAIQLPLAGHVAGDTWIINISVTATVFDLQALYPVLFDDVGVDTSMLNLYLDSATVFVKGLASYLGYRLHDLNDEEALNFGQIIIAVAGALTGMAVDIVTQQGQTTYATLDLINQARTECRQLLQGAYNELHRKVI